MKQPTNTNFQKVLEFGKEILAICNELNITPLVYGSLAYFGYTQDETLPVNDIDFLVPESSFQDLRNELDRLEGIRYEQMPYHSIEVFKGDLEIDLDSIEHFLGSRSQESSLMVIGGVKFTILNKESLISIYQEALDNMPDERHLDEKRQKYQKKLQNLQSI